LSQEFKVKPEEVVSAVEKQRLALQGCNTQIKDLRKELIKAHLPAWTAKVETLKHVPFLFLHLDDYAGEDLREIGIQLQQHKKGFYFLVCNAEGASSFFATLDQGYAERVNLKEFAGWLKTVASLTGGGKPGTLQGGGPRVSKQLEQQIKDYLQQ